MTRSKLTGQSFAFAERPSVGLALSVAGQRYDLVDLETYQRQTGEPGELSVWMASCRECGREFLCKSLRLKFPEVRRCAECRPTMRKIGEEL